MRVVPAGNSVRAVVGVAKVRSPVRPWAFGPSVERPDHAQRLPHIRGVELYPVRNITQDMGIRSRLPDRARGAAPSP